MRVRREGSISFTNGSHLCAGLDPSMFSGCTGCRLTYRIENDAIVLLFVIDVCKFILSFVDTGHCFL